MTPLGVFARGTPGRHTPDAGIAHVPTDGRPALELLHALARLVLRVEESKTAGSASLLLDTPSLGAAALGTPAYGGPSFGTPALGAPPIEPPTLVAVRNALRQLTARSREGALLLRLDGSEMTLRGATVPAQALDDAALQRLQIRLRSGEIGALTVREGAAPGELLSLARWIVDMPAPPAGASRERFRTWSVLATAAESAEDAAAAVTSAAGALTRLAAARGDAAASAAVASLLDVLDDAERRGDAAAIESVARACMAQLRVIGGGGGRLAIEGAIRRLLRPGTLELLATRLPSAPDPDTLLQLFARAGDAGVGSLLAQLLVAENADARRVYFDGIVAMDVGATLLFDALRDPRWFVVRNAASLLGEMGVEQGDVVLLPLLSHADDRIRIAAGRALLRLRSAAALNGLHHVVDDANPEVRRLSAAAYGIAGSMRGRSRPPAGPLAAALDREQDDDVALEMLAALGRLGSSHAVQRLLRIALPPAADRGATERVVPREAWVRIAAMEALIQARGHAMVPAIETLMGDADADVAAAAVRLYGSVGG